MKLHIKKIMCGIFVLAIIHLFLNILILFRFFQASSDTKVTFLNVVSAGIMQISWIIGVKIGYINEYDLNNYQVKNYSNENEDWEIINTNIFIARKFSFYFHDDQTVSTIIITKEFQMPYMTCLVQVSTNTLQKSFIITPIFYSIHTSGHITSYKLECPLRQLKFDKHKSYGFRLYFIYKNSFFKLIDLTREVTKRAIDLTIKSKSQNKSTQQKIALCGPMLYLDNASYDNFKTWLQINVKIGYQKILLYVLSLENESKFNRLFNKHKGVVEVKRYKYIPDIYYRMSNRTNPFINPESHVNTSKINRKKFFFDHDDTHLVQHSVVINGCFLTLYKEYDRISVIDNDELIFPNSGKIEYLFDDSKVLKPVEDMMKQLKNVKCEYNMNKYINNLNEIYFNKTFKTNISLWMHYSHYLDSEIVEKIFHEFKIYTQNMSTFKNNFTISINDKRNISFSIQNENDFIYLKNLINFYDHYYLNGEFLSKLGKNSFKRIWIIQESRKKELGWGKVRFYLFNRKFLLHNFNFYLDYSSKFKSNKNFPSLVRRARY
jgi:hypothetical protein